MYENQNEIIIKIRTKKCVKFVEDSEYPECLEREIKHLEYILTKEVVNKLITEKDIQYKITGKLISKEFENQ
jgi:hypothetical protein